MAATRDWTIEEQAELIRAVKLLRPAAEIAATLQRDEMEVAEKLAELGLEPPSAISEGRPSSR
jgi:hypothetical protein